MAITTWRPTNTRESKEGVGGTIITPRDTLAQFAVIDSTTAVWCGGYSLPYFHPGHLISSDKAPNKKEEHLHPKTSNQFILVDHRA